MEGYAALLIMILAAAGLGGAMIFLNYLLGPVGGPAVKFEPFECGSDPVGSPRRRFNVKYSVVALLFIVFDIEAVFLFPWAVVYKRLGLFGLVEMLVFIALLVVGLVYILRRGVLDWNPPPVTARGVPARNGLTQAFGEEAAEHAHHA